MAGYRLLTLRFSLIFPLFLLLFGLAFCPPVSADLLSLNLKSSGVLEAAVSDVQAKDTRRFKKGDTLLCRWRLPDIDSIEWPLKARGIVYKRAYRRCWKAGTNLKPYLPAFSGDGSLLVFNTRTQGVWIMDRRGKFNQIPGFEMLVKNSPEIINRSLVPVKGSREFFALQTYKEESFISILFDSWKSDIRWIPDLMFFRNSSLIMSRGNSRVEALMAASREDFLLAEALTGIEGEIALKNAELSETGAPLSGKEFSTSEEEDPEIDWPWLDMLRLVQEKLLSLKSIKKDNENGKTGLYFLLNKNRIGRLVPGEADMTLYPEFDSYVLGDEISSDSFAAAFRLLDPETAIVLGTKGIYRLDLMTGHHEMAAGIPWQRIKHLYGELALSPDHRYSAFRAWTTAQRQEIFLVELATGKVRVVVKGEMDLSFIPGRDSEARFNPGAFNFTPDGMALATLWRVLDGQEMRVYRLLNGDLAPLPPKIEPEEDEENADNESSIEKGHALSVDKKNN